MQQSQATPTQIVGVSLKLPVALLFTRFQTQDFSAITHQYFISSLGYLFCFNKTTF